MERNYLGLKQPIGYPPLPETWTTEVETLLATDGKSKLFSMLHRKKDPNPIRRVLIVAHGFGEHGGRYLHFPYFLDKSIDAVFVYDHRGHGRSDGIRGDVDFFDALVDDLKSMIEHVHAKLPSAELHLLAHSLGGHIGLRLGFLHAGLPLKSFQISAPYLALFQEPVLPLKVAAMVLSKVWGSLSLSADFDSKVLSRDERVVENAALDRLNHQRMTPRFFASMTAALKDTLRRTSGLHYPLSLHLPLADQLVNAVVTRKFYDRLQNDGKQLFEYPEFFHEAMNDTGKETFFENMRLVIDSASSIASLKT